MTFEEFYPEYLAAHADPRTRAVHAVGLVSGLTVGTLGLLQRKPKYLAAGLALGYLPAFVSHWMFEGNQPKTFEQPLNSFKGDFVMVFQLLTGRLAVDADDRSWTPVASSAPSASTPADEIKDTGTT